MSWSPRARDVVLSGAAALLGLASLGLAMSGPPGLDKGTAPPVASVQRSAGTLQMRLAQTLGWRSLVRGDDVHSGDAVFVTPGAEAQLLFVDGTVLELDERSLVVIEPSRGQVREVTLKQGAVSSRVGSSGLRLSTPAGETHLTPQTEARVELNPEGVQLSVTRGGVTVKRDGGEERVSEGQRAQVTTADVEALAPWPVELVAPLPQHRRLFHGAPPPLELSWSGSVPKGARLQLARDRLFAFVASELALTGTSLTVEPSPGVTWWRIADARGEPLSESRRFTMLADVPPRPLVPRDGEVVMAPPGATVGFSWAPVPGIARYRLELSASRGFEPVAYTEDVQGSQARLPLALAEGAWFWRVQAADADLGETGRSTPAKFRLIHKAIPEAPELLKPEIEVTP